MSPIEHLDTVSGRSPQIFETNTPPGQTLSLCLNYCSVRTVNESGVSYMTSVAESSPEKTTFFATETDDSRKSVVFSSEGVRIVSDSPCGLYFGEAKDFRMVFEVDAWKIQALDESTGVSTSTSSRSGLVFVHIHRNMEATAAFTDVLSVRPPSIKNVPSGSERPMMWMRLRMA